MGYGSQQDAYEAACVELASVKAELARVDADRKRIKDFLTDLAVELSEDSSGDWGEERDPVGVGWERACKHYADRIKKAIE